MCVCVCVCVCVYTHALQIMFPRVLALQEIQTALSRI